MSISTLVSGCSLAERAADVVAMDRREIAIQDDDVVGHDARLVEGGGAVGGDVHRHAFSPQSARDRTGDPGFVLGDQHAHGHPCWLRSMKR